MEFFGQDYGIVDTDRQIDPRSPPPHPRCILSWNATSPKSCYLTAASRRRGHFFLLVDLGPGAAARCRRGRVFFLVDLL